MVHAHAALPRLPLDPKRIAATSAVIALHVGVLMLLMMPAQVARAPLDDTEDMVIVPDTIRIPPPPPPPPTPPTIRHETAVQPIHQPVAITEPPVEPVDQNSSPIDTVVSDPDPIANTFDPAPAGTGFLQLTALLAPPPVYPRMAIQRHLTGTVTLRIHVDANGLPTEVMVENTSGHAILDEAAMKVVQKRWRFVPATRNGQPVEGWALVPVVFVLQ
jgi:protein TonB